MGSIAPMTPYSMPAYTPPPDGFNFNPQATQPQSLTPDYSNLYSPQTSYMPNTLPNINTTPAPMQYATPASPAPSYNFDPNQYLNPSSYAAPTGIPSQAQFPSALPGISTTAVPAANASPYNFDPGQYLSQPASTTPTGMMTPAKAQSPFSTPQTIQTGVNPQGDAASLEALLKQLSAGAGAPSSGMPVTPSASAGPAYLTFGCGQKLNTLA